MHHHWENQQQAAYEQMEARWQLQQVCPPTPPHPPHTHHHQQQPFRRS